MKYIGARNIAAKACCPALKITDPKRFIIVDLVTHANRCPPQYYRNWHRTPAGVFGRARLTGTRQISYEIFAWFRIAPAAFSLGYTGLNHSRCIALAPLPKTAI